ncbi:MAG TPA: hypothetical protein VH482_37625 [Thermomicrobiales bacterium]
MASFLVRLDGQSPQEASYLIPGGKAVLAHRRGGFGVPGRDRFGNPDVVFAGGDDRAEDGPDELADLDCLSLTARTVIAGQEPSATPPMKRWQERVKTRVMDENGSWRMSLPLPWPHSTRPSAARTLGALRTPPWLTPRVSPSSRSVGGR